MTSNTAVLEPAEEVESEGRQPLRRTDRDRRRFTLAVAIGFAVVTLPFLWILWDLWTGTYDLTRQFGPDNFYDLQARAMFHGHLYLPNGSIGIEAFVHGGRQYTYFGLFPSLLRMPLLLLTSNLDGQLTAPSMLLAWLATGLFASLLLWRVRVLVRGHAVLGRAETVACGFFVAAITGGSVLLYLAASPKVSHEDLAWSVALTLGALFALLGLLEAPSLGRVVASGLLVLAAGLDRGSTGYGCVLAALFVAGWFAVGFGGREQRRWALPALLVGVVPLVVVVAINVVKFGHLFGFSEADQVWTQVNAHRAYFLSVNGGSSFGLRFLPTTLTAYFQPAGLHIGSAFPYLTLPTGPARAVGHVVLDQVYPTASIPASMPLAFFLGIWGLVAAFGPRPAGRIRLVRPLLLAAAAATAGVLLFGYIADRYLADFLPILVLASIVGLVDVWRRLARSRRSVRAATLAVIAVVGIFGVWANVGAAITPSALWTTVQGKSFFSAQRSISGSSQASLLEQGRSLPYWAPAGTLFAVNGCSGLYVSSGFTYDTVPGQQLQHETWDPVERSPGFNHVLKVIFTRPVTSADPPVTLFTYGATSLRLVPTGADRVHLALEGTGAPSVHWPPATSTSQLVRVGRAYRINVTTDPNLTSIVVGGIGMGIDHYLGGKGPPVVAASGASPAGGYATVADLTRPSRQGTLCRSLVRSAAK
jgi:hypothetical protein